jgi:hypothetical protein
VCRIDSVVPILLAITSLHAQLPTEAQLSKLYSQMDDTLALHPGATTADIGTGFTIDHALRMAEKVSTGRENRLRRREAVRAHKDQGSGWRAAHLQSGGYSPFPNAREYPSFNAKGWERGHWKKFASRSPASRASRCKELDSGVDSRLYAGVDDSLQIGQVAQKTGLSVDAIRFYEKSRLLPRPARTESGYRFYKEREVADLESIEKVQRLGFFPQWNPGVIFAPA